MVQFLHLSNGSTNTRIQKDYSIIQKIRLLFLSQIYILRLDMIMKLILR